ncbi:LysM peptidoglycan-binding domain-containing M23 family metallopeptidase [Geosporobacter ferrireducens]|uniref:Peptidase M23 n=1 Tax=Geosporobacter ferrireducens TaxID=1424294 RepID=A0A1D8GHZ5_9FIRM|nr:M23 family metallopeptidase [Geosporobacter ferrireducens]AOT70541.1 hypothetical protein Gferi_13750 [Geosporobacter ferrireducens]MTI57099.1 M23 family metallopeptidase [Geosporobacter ferrireducens]
MPIRKFPEQIQRQMISFYKKLSRRNRKRIMIGMLALLVIVPIITVIYHQNQAFTVKVDGKVVGVVRKKEDFSSIIERIERNLHNAYNTEVVFNQNITYEKTRAKDEALTDQSTLQKSVQAFMNFKVKAHGIKVNDQVIAVLATQEEAERVLADLKKNYTPAEGASVEKIYFGENVTIEEVSTETKELKNYEDTMKLIQQGTEEVKIHQVEKGESFWSIAKKYDLKVDDLIKANPGINPDKLQLKQEVSLVVPKPLITIATIEKTRLDEKIPFDVEFEETAVLFKGETRIKVEGKDGRRQILAEIVKQNGIEVSRNILEENILEDPKKQIVLKGTKDVPPKVGTGTFSNPTRGSLSSRFGWRWGSKHEGIDIAAKIGTAVHAADGGKVTFAGTRGNYGKLVIIDHGGGYQTYYAHNSKIVVSTGTKVHKGQKIAEVGNTGRTTGPHLHFEVRKNGTPVNPLNYVKY